MQLPPKPSSKSGPVPAAAFATATLPGVTALAALNHRTGKSETGSGLEPETGEGVDVLAVAMAPAPASGREDAEEAAHPVPQPRRGAAEAAVRYGADIAARARSAKVTGRAGELLVIEPPRGAADLPGKLIFTGIGDESPASLRRAGAALARATMGANKVRSSVVDGLGPAAQAAFIEGFLLGGYRPPRAGITDAPAPIAAHLELTGLDDGAARRALAGARAVWLARDLTNTPADTATPDWIAGQARSVAGSSGLQVRVRSEAELRAEGFGGLLAVGSGSEHPPRLVEVSYVPSGDGDAEHVVLVGKGITFDSGGISLKPRDAMMTMKTDMAGAAAVLAVAQAAAELELPVRVTAVLALAENAIGAASYRPADVVTTYNGTTVEVGNTDAEGRMVLADALAYAAAELSPDVLIDVATLTGAAALGLGLNHAALFGNAPGVLTALETAGQDSGDAVWQMPLVAEYADILSSDVADVAHIAPVKAKFGAGAIVAALFLEKFTHGVPWAHVDIAGPARTGKDSRELVKGATGFGVRLLLAYLAGKDSAVR